MGVLFVADHLAAPSHLWMRRMLDGLHNDVALLADSQDSGVKYAGRFPVVALKDDPAPILRRGLRRAGLAIACKPKITSAEKLRLAADRPDVSVVLVHFLTRALEYDAVWRRIAAPVFVHCHGYDVTWDLRYQEGPTGGPVHPPDYVERVLALPRNVKFIANSHDTRSRLTKIGVSPRRIAVKYLGVEVPDQPPVRSDRGREINILYIGRLIDCKGPDLLIRAFDRACDLGLQGTLTLAGDGPLRLTCEMLRERSASRDRIKLLGTVDADTGVALRAHADVFSAHNCLGPVSRQQEAFGVSFVEAMAGALPIVSTCSGSLPEIVDDGVQGLLVKPGDVNAHAHAFLRLARDNKLRHQMGVEGWRRARSTFSTAQEMATLRNILGLDAAVTPARQDQLNLEAVNSL